MLLDGGWRTRVPQRAVPRDGTALAERRRLRHASYEEVERSQVVVHVPAPARFSGSKLHRELQHALSHGVPVAVLVALPDRHRLGVGLPAPDRIRELMADAHPILIESLSDLLRAISVLRRAGSHRAP